MDIQYVGHSCFRLRGREGLVVTDPYDAKMVGLPLPTLTADVVTVSHQHGDHNFSSAVKGTTRKEKPFIISQPGEYEVQGITVVGYPTFHDASHGAERGKNIIFSIFIDDVHVLHLGDLGHALEEKDIEDIPDVDVLLCPVGGFYTLDPQQATEVITSLEPAYVVPMHYRTPQHNSDTFGQMATLEDFLKTYAKTPKTEEKLTLSGPTASEEVETQLVVLAPKGA